MDDLIVVTGGAGFIGSHLVDRLVAGGGRVRVVERPGAAVDHLPAAVEVVRADIRDRRGRPRALPRGPGSSTTWRRTRTSGSATAASSTRSTTGGRSTSSTRRSPRGAERVVHCSTESILTRADVDGPIDEESRSANRTRSGPTASRSSGPSVAAFERARAGAPVVVVNPTMPVGPGDRGPSPPSRLMLDFCNGRLPAVMDCTLNLIDVRDVAEGIDRAMGRGRPGRRYLLGGENLTLLGLLAILAELTGARVPRLRVPYLIALTMAHLRASSGPIMLGGGPPQATVDGGPADAAADALRHIPEPGVLGLAPAAGPRIAGRRGRAGTPRAGRSAPRRRHGSCPD